VSVEAENPQNTTRGREIAANRSLQEREAARTPPHHGVEVEQVHFEEQVDRRDGVAASKQRRDRTHNARVVFVAPVIVDCDALHCVAARPAGVSTLI